ncbi:MAG: 2Fe-2S iron-sulfur cluster binding domain-containing protein, partial [Methylococcales bacterium]|nr:2Fe-2S iron-sulfur cluster binding domain-containing protein [Methylococcales bacterium]
MFEIISGIITFTILVLLLVAVILVAKKFLVQSGNVTITINDDPDKAICIPAGGKLLGALASEKIFISSACGGGGTCGQCTVIIEEGGGEILPTELTQISKREAK